MSITENGSIQYTIPPHIKEMITPEFCAQFLKELHIIFGVGVEDTDMDYFVYLGGTAGWSVAWATACRKLGLDELYKYYSTLPWYDSDVFDGEIEDILVHNNLILGGFLYEEVARQNNIPQGSVISCAKCGRYYHLNNVIKNEIDLEIEGDDEPYIEDVCKSCANIEDADSLPINIGQTIDEVLHRNPLDFFLCESCGKTHYLTHRGQNYCMYCEEDVESECQNANNYYRKMLEEQKRYRDRIFRTN
jgi:hypothetical protein